MAPAKTEYRDNLETAGLASVATKPVAKVNSSQQRSIQTINQRTLYVGVVQILEVSVTLQSQTEHRGKPATYPDASVRGNVAEPSVMLGAQNRRTGRGGQSAIYSKVEIVKSLALCNSLSRC